jgi:hypothetical protein
LSKQLHEGWKKKELSERDSMTSKVKESLRKGPLGCGYLNMFQDGGKE